MSITINQTKCIGCGKCRNVCPGTLIAFDNNKKAYIKYPYDCWGCTSCLKECPVHAILFFLGADMGGMGSVLYTQKDGDIIHWITEKSDGSISEIQVDTKISNKY